MYLFLTKAFEDLLELTRRYGKFRDAVVGEKELQELLNEITEQENLVDLEYLQEEAAEGL
jgi:hypothetical protein